MSEGKKHINDLIKTILQKPSKADMEKQKEKLDELLKSALTKPSKSDIQNQIQQLEEKMKSVKLNLKVSDEVKGLSQAFQSLNTNIGKIQRQVPEEKKVDIKDIANAFFYSVSYFWLAYNITSTFKNLSKDISEAIKLIYEDGGILEQFSIIVLSLKWTPPLDLDFITMKRAIDIYNSMSLSEAEKQIDKIIINYYTKDVLLGKLKNWENKQWLKKRFPILKSAVNAHINKDYNLSIPAVLPQIEGVIADGFYHRDEMNGKKYKSYVNNLFKDIHKGYFDKGVQEFVANILLVTFKHNNPINSFLSRHAILHGGDCNYGSEKNSLKTLLLFDYLQDSFRLISLNNSKTYHLVGCGIVNKGKSEKKFYKSHDEAKKDKKAPCKICKPNL